MLLLSKHILMARFQYRGGEDKFYFFVGGGPWGDDQSRTRISIVLLITHGSHTKVN